MPAEFCSRGRGTWDIGRAQRACQHLSGHVLKCSISHSMTSHIICRVQCKNEKFRALVLQLLSILTKQQGCIKQAWGLSMWGPVTMQVTHTPWSQLSLFLPSLAPSPLCLELSLCLCFSIKISTMIAFLETQMRALYFPGTFHPLTRSERFISATIKVL